MNSKQASLLFNSLSFLSAFLLFAIQPLMSRAVLPMFGGSSAVWTSCLVFFQTGLLAGYFLAFLLIRYTSLKIQQRVYFFGFLCSFGALAMNSDITPRPGSLASEPALEIVLLLCRVLGLPFVVLSSTSPLLHSWFSRYNPGRSPFHLYRLSNAGSLSALFVYPLLIEPFFRLGLQFDLWKASFLLLTVFVGLFIAQYQAAPEDEATIGEEKVFESGRSRWELFLWFLFPFLSSVILLGFTHHLTIDVAPVPLLWVMPLSLYLLSFIVSFRTPPMYTRRAWFYLLAGVCFFFSGDIMSGPDVPLMMNIAFCLAGLFVCCMVCHAEVFRLRPPENSLSAFYLAVAAGGAAGSLFVSLCAPRIFNRSLELPLALCALLVLLAYIITTGSEKLNPNYPEGRFPSERLLVWSFCSFGLLWFYVRWEKEKSELVVFRDRNFYGELRVFDRIFPEKPENNYRSLINGRIMHGYAYLDPALSRSPVAYYGENSAVKVVFDFLRDRPKLKVGVVGLGMGGCAAWRRAEDQFRFYELDPLVPQIARNYFDFIKGGDGYIDIVMGDARLSLAQEPPQHFDLLILDAFSSDAIPFHLLTREALELYLRHLGPDGLLMVHASNRHLNLEPVVLSTAFSLGLHAGVIEAIDRTKELENFSIYVIASKGDAFFRSQPALERLRHLESDTLTFAAWTDDFSPLIGIARWFGVSQLGKEKQSGPKVTDIADYR